MKIKIIDYGYKYRPKRSYYNDTGADVYAPVSCKLPKHSTIKIPLGFGIELPDGYAGFIYPRSSLASKGIVCEIPPIDAGYKGEIIAIVSNISNEDYQIEENDRIGQLVIVPVILADFVEEIDNSRHTDGFGSTGK